MSFSEYAISRGVIELTPTLACRQACRVAGLVCFYKCVFLIVNVFYEV